MCWRCDSLLSGIVSYWISVGNSHTFEVRVTSCGTRVVFKVRSINPPCVCRQTHTADEIDYMKIWLQPIWWIWRVKTAVQTCSLQLFIMSHSGSASIKENAASSFSAIYLLNGKTHEPKNRTVLLDHSYTNHESKWEYFIKIQSCLWSGI